MTGCSPRVYIIDPLSDHRWPAFLDHHPRASVFHTPEWLDALKRTYAYEPFVLTTTATGPLENGLPVCRVRTWAARRLVSLPFSDHCEPLVDRPDDLAAMVECLGEDAQKERWRSVELRPRFERFLADGGRPSKGGDGPGSVLDGGRPFRVAESARYVLHSLDLARPVDEVFRGFHPSHTQRAIRRAEREGLGYEAGSSDSLLAAFYGLLRLTRRRHGLPPQPFAWFRNLAACLGDRLAVHVASQDGQPVAAILTLTFKQTMVYKYGGSDASRHALGGMPFLFWRAIQEAQARGVAELDLGRSDLDQPGLSAFKEHLGATKSELSYCRWPARRPGSGGGFLSGLARKAVPFLPDTVLDWTGRLLYRHLG